MRKKVVKKNPPKKVVVRADRFVIGWAMKGQGIYGELASAAAQALARTNFHAHVAYDGHSFTSPMTLAEARQYVKTFGTDEFTPLAVYELVPKIVRPPSGSR